MYLSIMIVSTILHDETPFQLLLKDPPVEAFYHKGVIHKMLI